MTFRCCRPTWRGWRPSASPAGLQPTLDGKLVGNLAAGFDQNAGYLLVPAIRNYADPRATDPDTVLADPRQQRSAPRTRRPDRSCRIGLRRRADRPTATCPPTSARISAPSSPS
ncbi:MAG: hypothetical protein U0703_13355 [Anaerolineae bacterium]